METVEDTKEMIQSIECNYLWLTIQINLLTFNSDAKHNNATYNISGMKVGANAKGIIIRNGRKRIVK